MRNLLAPFMKRLIPWPALLLVASAGHAFAVTESSKTESEAANVATSMSIGQLAAADQADRKRQPPMPMEEIRRHDAERRVQVLGLLRDGALKTSQDYHDAALVLQHGETVADARLAFAMATISTSLAPTSKPAAWLEAAAWDRLMMRHHRPQWYGTQYVPSDDGKCWMLYDFDPAPISDEERIAAGVDKAADVARTFARQARPSK